jgi:hypothetical protein
MHAFLFFVTSAGGFLDHRPGGGSITLENFDHSSEAVADCGERLISDRERCMTSSTPAVAIRSPVEARSNISAQR